MLKRYFHAVFFLYSLSKSFSKLAAKLRYIYIFPYECPRYTSNSVYSQADLIIYPQIYFFSSVPRKVKGTTNLQFNQVRFLCVSSYFSLATNPHDQTVPFIRLFCFMVYIKPSFLLALILGHYQC